MKLKYFAMLISFLFSTNSFAVIGKEGGGGIIVSAKFATAGRGALRLLAMGDPSLNLSSVLNKIKEVKVIPVDNICYKDPVLKKTYCEDAHFDKVNNVVLINYAKWSGFSCKEKLVLSSHEFLRAAGYETEDYSYSGRFLNGQIAQCSLRGGTSDEDGQCADLWVRLRARTEELCSELQ